MSDRHIKPQRLIRLTLSALLAVSMSCVRVTESPHATPTSPDPLVGPPRAQVAISPDGMVATSSPAAAKVGARVLAEGGNAVDAAVATVLALGVADPAAIGLGGDLVMVIHTADGRNTTIDDPSFAPLRVQPKVMAELKKTHKSWQAWGRRGSTVPTTMAILGTALEQYGTWNLDRVAQPAVELAHEGFELGWYQRAVVSLRSRGLADSPLLTRLFLGPDASLPAVGATVNQNPALAATLERLSAVGWRDFYTGKIAQEIDQDMRENDGWISRTDLARVPLEIRERPPIQTTYRGRTVLAPGAPWGGPTLATALEILEHFPPELLQRDSVDRLHLLVEAVRLAQYDRLAELSQNNSLPGFGSLDWDRKSRAATLAQLISFASCVPVQNPDARIENGLGEHTTQISVMDRSGNAVSITGSLGWFFGAKAAGTRLGFLYNSFMDGFQYEDPRKPGFGGPLTKIRSELCPTIVLEDGRPVEILGTGGSSKIPGFVLSVLSCRFDRGMSPAEAVSFPRVTWGGPAEPEICFEVRPPVGAGAPDELRRRGFDKIMAVTYPATVVHRGYLGAVDSVAYDPASGLFTGVGDGRRDGFAAAPPNTP